MFLCFVFLMLSSLFIAALWSPAGGKGLTSWLLLVIFIVFLLLSHVVSWARCGTLLYRFLIFAVVLTLLNSNCKATILKPDQHFWKVVSLSKIFSILAGFYVRAEVSKLN